jgi:two-component system, OmpR family, response regulator
MRILVVEDDVKMARLLRRGLGEDGLEAEIAATGETALRMAAEGDYDAVILDLMLPGIDGVTVCRRLREAGAALPVLMLTARGATDDRVAGLDAGADDYLTKPFVFAELLARLRAMARRPVLAGPSAIAVGDLRLDPAGHRAWRGEHQLDLSAKEFELLQAFMLRPDQVISRPELLNLCWYGRPRGSNVVDTFVRQLRDKIDRPFEVESLETVRGAGYRLRADGGLTQC